MDLTPPSLIRSRRLALPERGPGEVAILDLGPPDRPVDLVFVHANGFNALTYSRILAPLTARWRVLAFDQRGHGATTLPAEPAARGSWLDLRDDLLALAHADGWERIVLSGHSMGATAGVLAAAQSASLARSLVLFDPVMVPAVAAQTPTGSPLVEAARRRRPVFPSREAARTHYLGRGAFASWPRELVEDYVGAGFRDLPDGAVTLACTPEWEASNYAAHAHDSFAALAQVAAPVEIFAAEIGSTLRAPPSGPEAELLERVALHTIAGASHFLPMERPDVVRKALEAALEQP